jgi:Tfp pilus assembly protein PilF
MRYGARSTREIEKALQLDPKNAEAHIARATSYFYTPSAFGGSKDKAISELRTALTLEPKSDTARIWLAQVYGDLKQMDRAAEELREALRINPQRKFTHYVVAELKVKL